MTRKEIHDIMFRTHTLEQCAEAWKPQGEYLQEHPEDEGEALWMHEQALKNMAAQKQEGQTQAERVAWAANAAPVSNWKGVARFIAVSKVTYTRFA